MDNKNEFGKSLKYTPSDAVGNYYVKWVDIQPNTDYVFSFNVKILKDGAGKLSLIEDNWGMPVENFAFEFDEEIFGNDWYTITVAFDSSNFERLGIGVCDAGGEALLDNIRLFKVSDAKAVTDPYKDPDGGSATVPTATVRPTAKPTTKPTGGVEGDTTTSTTMDVVDGDPTGDVVTDPTDAQPTEPSQGGEDVAPDTDVDTDAEPKDEGGFPWLIVGIAGGAVLLIAAGVVVFLILRKKK